MWACILIKRNSITYSSLTGNSPRFSKHLSEICYGVSLVALEPVHSKSASLVERKIVEISKKPTFRNILMKRDRVFNRVVECKKLFSYYFFKKWFPIRCSPSNFENSCNTRREHLHWTQFSVSLKVAYWTAWFAQ